MISPTNVIMRTRGVVPIVGMGATILLWTDRHAATVVRISKNERTIWIKRDTVKLINQDKLGIFGRQDYLYAEDPTAPEECFTLRRNGLWVRKGEGMKTGTSLSLGVRNEYHDPHF